MSESSLHSVLTTQHLSYGQMPLVSMEALCRAAF
jgi:hypothetical protein